MKILITCIPWISNPSRFHCSEKGAERSLKKIISAILIFTFLLLLSACGKKKEEKLHYVEFCYYETEKKMNILSTKESYIQRYIEGRGAKKVDFIIDDDEQKKIFDEIKEHKLDEITGEIKTSGKADNSVTKYIVRFKIDEREYELRGDYTSFDYMKDSDETKRFCNFVQFIMEYMRSTDEFNSLN